MNLMEELGHAFVGLDEMAGREINFYGGDTHARIVGLQCRKHEMKELIGFLEVASPGAEVSTNHAQGCVGLFHGQLEQTLRLLLRSQMGDFFEFGLSAAWIGRGNQGSGVLRRKRCRNRMNLQPIREGVVKTSGEKSGKSGKKSKHNEVQSVSAQPARTLHFGQSLLGNRPSRLRWTVKMWVRFAHKMCCAGMFPRTLGVTL